MTAAQAISKSEMIIFDLFHTLVSFKSDGTSGRNTSEVLGIPEEDWNRLLWESSDRRLRHNLLDDASIVRGLAHQEDPGLSEARIIEVAEVRAEPLFGGFSGCSPALGGDAAGRRDEVGGSWTSPRACAASGGLIGGGYCDAYRQDAKNENNSFWIFEILASPGGKPFLPKDPEMKKRQECRHSPFSAASCRRRFSSGGSI